MSKWALYAEGLLLRNDLAELEAMDRKLLQLAAKYGRMIPENPDRNDWAMEVYNRLGGAGAEVARARRVLTSVILKELGDA